MSEASLFLSFNTLFLPPHIHRDRNIPETSGESNAIPPRKIPFRIVSRISDVSMASRSRAQTCPRFNSKSRRRRRRGFLKNIVARILQIMRNNEK